MSRPAYAALKQDRQALHLHYLRAPERPGGYDPVSFTAGPLSLAERHRALRPATMGWLCPRRHEPLLPHYPRPAARRPSVWAMFFSKRRSWLDGLYERSYRMKMGEVHLPGVDLYMVNEPALVHQVMDHAEAFPKHEMLGEALRPLLGDSIFTTNGAVWQRQRTLMNPSFEGARVRKVLGRMRAAGDAMVQRLRAVPPGGVHDVEMEMTHVAADIILRTILSQSLDSEGAQRIFAAFARYQALAPRLMMPAFFGLRWLRPWWQIRRSRGAAREIRSLLEAYIRPRYEAARGGRGREDDILASLLRVRDEATGEGFGFDELVDQVAMLFLAGHETSASALSWALHLLAHDPQVQERLHEEACRVLPALDTEGANAIKDLTLARDVFRETLRLFPPVGFWPGNRPRPAPCGTRPSLPAARWWCRPG
jgi:cytochrome P450